MLYEIPSSLCSNAFWLFEICYWVVASKWIHSVILAFSHAFFSLSPIFFFLLFCIQLSVCQYLSGKKHGAPNHFPSEPQRIAESKDKPPTVVITIKLHSYERPPNVCTMVWCFWAGNREFLGYFLWFYYIQNSLISVLYSTAAPWYFFLVNVLWNLWIFTAFQSYKLLRLSCTHLHFSELNFILSFSSHVPKLSRCFCSTRGNFQFSGSICCAPVRACLNKFFSSGVVIGCTVIYIFFEWAVWEISSDNTNVLLRWYQRIYNDLNQDFSMH